MVVGSMSRVANSIDDTEMSLNERERRGLGTPGSCAPRRDAYSGSVDVVVNVNAAIPIQIMMSVRDHRTDLDEVDELIPCQSTPNDAALPGTGAMGAP